jgi:membrane protein
MRFVTPGDAPSQPPRDSGRPEPLLYDAAGRPLPPPGWAVFRQAAPTFRYWMETEVHVYGFSIAANVLLSFFPFLIVMVSLCNALQWKEAADAVYLALAQYFPDEVGAFLARNLRASIQQRGPVQIGSIILLMFVANGIFEPLEVALNRIWGVTKNRSFLRNQLLSMAMIFLCGSLALMSIALASINLRWLKEMGLPLSGPASYVVAEWAFKASALPITALLLFFIYWLLPNRRVPAKLMILPAVGVAIALEAAKYLNLLLWPLLREKLRYEYGPFINSAAIVLWSFLAAMIVLAGAEWAARYWREGLRAEEQGLPEVSPELLLPKSGESATPMTETPLPPPLTHHPPVTEQDRRTVL